MTELNGRTALVTGSVSGIGLGVARDRAQARELFARACSLGMEEACRVVGQ